MTDQERQKPSWTRILASLFYDGLLILAFWLLGTFLLALVVSPAHHDLEYHPIGKLLYWIFLLGLPWLFLTWFWVHGGQTLGMKAWRLRLEGQEERPVSLRAASVRFGVACLEWLVIGVLLLPFFWLIKSATGEWSLALSVYLTGWIVTVFLCFAWSSRLQRGSLHDRLSRTHLCLER